jgi:hypothetical protein
VPCHLLTAIFQGVQVALRVLAKAPLLSARFLPVVECFPQRPPASKIPWREIGCLISMQARTHTGKDTGLFS